jgi:hypothetical protein
MGKQRIEALVWVLIYGGGLALIAGWFVQPSLAALGWVLMVGGAALAASGTVLIFLRSRMEP